MRRQRRSPVVKYPTTGTLEIVAKFEFEGVEPLRRALGQFEFGVDLGKPRLKASLLLSIGDGVLLDVCDQLGCELSQCVLH